MHGFQLRLDSDVEKLYAVALREGPCESAHLRAASGLPPASAQQAEETLLVLGLLETHGRQVRAVAPRVPIETRAAQLEHQVRDIRGMGSRLGALYTAALQQGEAFVDVISGRTQIAALYNSMQESASAMFRGLNREPYVTAGTDDITVQLAALARGIQYRVIYDTSQFGAVEDVALSKVVMDAGEDARVFPDLPMKLVIRDSSMALVALLSDDQIDPVAVVVRPSLLLNALEELFESFWRLAIPIAPSMPTDAESSDTWRAGCQRLISLLAAGLTDESIARELGVSERTVQRRIARLQELLAAKNRFQLGIQAARRGWL